MGADRTVFLWKDISDEQIENILNHLKWSFSKQKWGWSTNLDVSKVHKGIHLHYGYWGLEHSRGSEQYANKLIRYLKQAKLLRNPGKWSY